MRTSVIFRSHSHKESEKEISNESFRDLGEFPSIYSERNDHSYLCIRSSKAGTLLYKKLNELHLEKRHEIRRAQQLETFNSFKENVTPNTSLVSDLQLQDTPLPVKKKRGRKPGSKRKNNDNQTAKNLNDGLKKIYYSPTLKNPGDYLALIFFTDTDDKIYLRNTSRDVILSSTLPFGETPEYLVLKEMHDNMCNENKRLKQMLPASASG